jgi:hypothetical protein
MEAQGYQVQDNILFQDNKSAILLEKNGKASSSKHTKHVNIRYFFITDRVDKGNVSLVWCPTGDMIGDFMTKPLQKKNLLEITIYFLGITQNPGILVWESYLFVIFVVSDSLFIPAMAPTNEKTLVCSMCRATREGMHDDGTGISALTKMPRNNNFFLHSDKWSNSTGKCDFCVGVEVEWSKDIQTQAPAESSLLTGPKKVTKMDISVNYAATTTLRNKVVASGQLKSRTTMN